MATILLSMPEHGPRLVLSALIEALGHEVVEEPGESVDVAVIEPASQRALTAVRGLRAEQDRLPVICVSGRRRGAIAMRLDPVAYIKQPVPVGTFVRAVETALERAAGSASTAAA